ncbi:MAG: nucleotide exchange factor GrpE, partial [Cyclobacteriaceae bacterium]
MEKNTEQEEQTEKKEEILEDTVPKDGQEEESKETTKEKPAEEQDPFKKLQDDLAEAKDKYVRLYAEFDNHRRRTSKEKLELIQNANEQLIVTLLPILDDFERAEKSNTEKNNSDVEGFLLIKSKLVKAFDQYGVKPMEVAAESEFDPDLHEAITQVPAPDEKLKGKIVDVIRSEE